METGEDKRDLVDTTLAMFSTLLRGVGAVGSDYLCQCQMVLDTVCHVWEYQNRRRGGGDQNNRRSMNTYVILETLVKILDSRANWCLGGRARGDGGGTGGSGGSLYESG